MAAVASLRAALENERSSLQQIDASIKRIVQSHHDRQYNLDRSSFNNSSDGGRLYNSGEGGRGLGGGGGGGRYVPRGADIQEEGGKRKHETKTVFSRLSVRHNGDSDPEDGGVLTKRPRISSQVTRDLPSKQEIMKAQCGDEQSKVRNRRMFGSLLGTLQKFKQEEIVLKSKEDKRAQVERRIEQQAVQERENQRRERQQLFAERELRKATIKALEAKLARVAEFDAWAASQSPLTNFIVTRTRPHIFWLPRKLHSDTVERVAASGQQHEKYMEKKRQELEDELLRIEQKCLRSAKVAQGTAHFAASKENKMSDRHDGGDESGGEQPSTKKREKFVSEVRVKEENGTVVKMEEDREFKKQRERRESKDHDDDVSGHDERTQHKKHSGKEHNEQPTVAEEGNSVAQRDESERRGSELLEEEMVAVATQNGSQQKSPTSGKPHEVPEAEEQKLADGGDTDSGHARAASGERSARVSPHRSGD